MPIIETIVDGGVESKINCDFCNEEPENGVLIEKPNSMIIKGQIQVSYRQKPLHICMGCLQFEIENL